MHGLQSGWKYMVGALRPVNAKALPPQANRISGKISIQEQDGCSQDQEFQVEARAGDVMACAGGAAGPAPDVRHQPPGDGKEES